MVNWKSKELGDYLWFANGIVLVVLLNLVASYYFFRVDLTEEQRYSIKPQTREILNSLEDEVYIEVFLEGELNAGFRRFQKSIKETLEEFRIYSGNKVNYIFTNPATANGQKAQAEYMNDLASRGIQPTNVIDTKDGQRVEKIIFPGAIVSVGGMESGLMLLKGSTAKTSDERINQSIENIEFELINTIYTLANTNRKRIGLVTGHGELEGAAIASFNKDIREVYDVYKVDLASSTDLKKNDALIIAKPRMAFSPTDKFKLDQYIMQGGRVMFLLDRMDASMDSAAVDNYFAVPYDLNLDDQLFKYGVRINPDLIQDQSAAPYPIVTGETGGKPQMQLIDWPFFPLINHYAEHPITRNLDAVIVKFASSIDTVKAPGIKKIPLLLTSNYTRTITAPVNVSVNELRKNVKAEDFSKSAIPVGYLLEGSFSSLFKNRFLPEGVDQATVIGESKHTKLIVVADGDIIRNEVNPRSRLPQPLGFYPFTNYTFANRELLMNALAYLTEDNGLIQARSKQIKIRPLDREKVKEERLKWQVINLGVPILLLIVFGVIRAYWRKNKFARF
ncbi:gliding motility-associated ABC transporter substrate-binding protein GldG [Ohtaekwangia koreensis]|uniref:Gliding-associated putative ABC transporter substrate-binding component GldG n=1 Tax=Ohtaekwangia koreensis TaxID=688867 RepID=A0A1T5MEE5_9BACT|nr:gliding motility-associated ABC transporter substrate-binding protein GldG [Ohtaekwangia koreensis]SKC86354.1 gliding-associated putative ABC transporter substrate-binding component GldG [Ohtaekwangia koreensis]